MPTCRPQTPCHSLPPLVSVSEEARCSRLSLSFTRKRGSSCLSLSNLGLLSITPPPCYPQALLSPSCLSGSFYHLSAAKLRGARMFVYFSVHWLRRQSVSVCLPPRISKHPWPSTSPFCRIHFRRHSPGRNPRFHSFFPLSDSTRSSLICPQSSPRYGDTSNH